GRSKDSRKARSLRKTAGGRLIEGCPAFRGNGTRAAVSYRRRGSTMAVWKWLVGLWMTAVILAAFLYAREAADFVPGSSRIIFFHVPMAMLAVVGFLLAMIHAVRYLTTRDPLADVKSETAAELGLLFCALATITGSIFAHVMWNSYWNWDPRETSILIQL